MRRQGKSNKVLGIDPGSLACGYGVIEAGEGGLQYVSSGRIVLSSRSPLHIRLKQLNEGLTDVIQQYGPTEAVVEKIFFAKNARSALSLGHARGIALLAAATGGLEVHEYSALQVKKAVTGYGRAEKRQVQEMIRAILGINGSLSPDSADALALAVCHINSMGVNRS